MDFTHFNEQGRAKMVDVGEKDVTRRRAVAGGRVLVAAKVGDTMEQAVEEAYAAVRKISWEHVQYRSDIAKRAFIKRT